MDGLSNNPSISSSMFSKLTMREFVQEYRCKLTMREFVQEYRCSGPNYIDRRRIYLAAKAAYLDMRRDYLEAKETYLNPEEIKFFDFDENYFLFLQRVFLAKERDFLSIKKDFLARKQDYQRSFEKDFESMRELFLGSKRDELTPSLGHGIFSHDVFLSFRGTDVRETLVDHLSQALSKAGLRVFLDSKNLKKGSKIWPSLKSAIEKSAICIPIFSEGYAESTWCLKESAAMLKTPHLIIPLFYGVDPSQVRYPLNKRSPFKKSFEKHYGHPDRHPQEEIDGWKSALGDICSRSGWAMGITEDFDVAVQGIVKDVIDILRSEKQ